jgi:hypothetical protein
MEPAMPIPYLAVPLVAAFLTVSNAVPRFDVTPSCKGAADAGYVDKSKERLQICIESEQKARAELEKSWAQFDPSDRNYCVRASDGFEPTYTELITCLEMQRDVKRIRQESATKKR